MSRKKLFLIFAILIVLILALFSVNLFLTRANIIEDGSLNWLTDKKIAHRGLHDNKDIVENSLSAFKLTIEENENIEIDVQRTKDNVIVVCHDYNLLRLTGVDKELKNLNYDELRELRLLNTDDYIPTLKEVLDLVDGKVGLLIEIKNEGDAGFLEAMLVKELKNYKGDFAIQAFNPFVLEWFKINANYIKRGQLAGGYEDSNLEDYEKFLLENLLLNFKAEPNFIAYNEEELPKDVVSRLRKKGVPILVWGITLDENQMVEKSLYDNIIYERK